MAQSLCVILRKAPYGVVNAAEALRHVNGGVTYGLRTTALLLDDGVYAARDHHKSQGKEWTLLSNVMKTTLEFSTRLPGGDTNQAHILVHEPSLKARGLAPQDLVPGVELASDEEVAQVLSKAEAILVY